MTQNRIRVLGVTGGIASGKSLVSRLLREKGGYVLDADKISHSVILKGAPAYKETLTKIKGDYITLDGQIDRSKLGAIVFEDKAKLKLLESIIHAHVEAEIREKIAKIKANGGSRFIVIDAPLLLESGAFEMCDTIWIISASCRTRLKRVMERNGLTEEQAKARIELQTDWDNIPDDGYVFIKNNGGIEELAAAVDRSLKDFLEK